MFILHLAYSCSVEYMNEYDSCLGTGCTLYIIMYYFLYNFYEHFHAKLKTVCIGYCIGVPSPTHEYKPA